MIYDFVSRLELRKSNDVNCDLRFIISCDIGHSSALAETSCSYSFTGACCSGNSTEHRVLSVLQSKR